MSAIRRPSPPAPCGPGPGRAPQRGFAMMTVIFVLVIMVGAAAALSTWGARNDHLSALAVRESRAAAAARAGLQWGAWQVRDPRGTLSGGTATMPGCFATQTFAGGTALPAPLDEFDVQVSCSRSPATGVYQEDQRSVVVFTLTATAVAGATGGPERVERRAEMRIEACKDPAGTTPLWAC